MTTTTTRIRTSTTSDHTSVLRHTRSRVEKTKNVAAPSRPLHPPQPPSEPSSLRYYPAYCFPASPTFGTWAHLSIADVHGLDTIQGFEFQNIFFHLNHPIKYIRLVGIIIAFDQYEERNVLTLDDGSGATIEVVCPRTEEEIQAQAQIRAGIDPSITLDCNDTANSTVADKDKGKAIDGKSSGSNTNQGINLTNYDVGSIVKVKGLVRIFRGIRQLDLKRISPITSTTQEIHAWEENTLFRSTILATPWSLSETKVQRLLDEANGARRREREKLQRRQLRKRKEEEREKRRVERETRRIDRQVTGSTSRQAKPSTSRQAKPSSTSSRQKPRDPRTADREETKDILRGNPLDARPSGSRTGSRINHVPIRAREMPVPIPLPLPISVPAPAPAPAPLPAGIHTHPSRKRISPPPQSPQKTKRSTGTSTRTKPVPSSSSSTSSSDSDSETSNTHKEQDQHLDRRVSGKTRRDAQINTQRPHHPHQLHHHRQSNSSRVSQSARENHVRDQPRGQAQREKLQVQPAQRTRPVGEFDALGL